LDHATRVGLRPEDIRVVNIGPIGEGAAARRIVRMVFPIRGAADYDSFVRSFDLGGNNSRGLPGLLLRRPRVDSRALKIDLAKHTGVVLGPGSYRLYARQVGNVGAFTAPGSPGLLLWIELSQPQADHVQGWFAARDDPRDILWKKGTLDSPWGWDCMDFISNVEVGAGPLGESTARLISQKELRPIFADRRNWVQRREGGRLGGRVALNQRGLEELFRRFPQGQTLFGELGIGRTKSGPELTARVARAANAGGMGIIIAHTGVRDLGEFRRRPVHELLGPGFTGGTNDILR
jgi:hypothetical protein